MFKYSPKSICFNDSQLVMIVKFLARLKRLFEKICCYYLRIFLKIFQEDGEVGLIIYLGLFFFMYVTKIAESSTKRDFCFEASMVVYDDKFGNVENSSPPP